MFISFILFMKFPALFVKRTQVRIHIYFIYFIYFILKASARINRIKNISIYFIYLIYFIFKASARIKKI